VFPQALRLQDPPDGLPISGWDPERHVARTRNPDPCLITKAKFLMWIICPKPPVVYYCSA